MKDDIVCVVPARGGSKGIPRKNLSDLGGKPLLAWTVEAALSSGAVDRVIVSTDTAEIAEAARAAGAEAPFLRPAELAQDQVHSVHAILHAADWVEAESGSAPAHMMMLLPTGPFRRPDQVRAAVELYRESRSAALVSVADIGKYMTNLRYIRDGRLVPLDPEEDPNAQRQGLERIFAVNGSIYIARTPELRAAGTFHLPGAAAFVMSQASSLDINDPADLAFARRLTAAMHPWTLDGADAEETR